VHGGYIGCAWWYHWLRTVVPLVAPGGTIGCAPIVAHGVARRLRHSHELAHSTGGESPNPCHHHQSL
jgi:hypothetical protein